MQPKIDLHREPGVFDRVVQIASTSELDMAADRAQRGAAAEAERAVSFHGAIDRPGQRGQACQSHLAIDESEVECGVVGNEKVIGRQKAPYVGGMNCERVLQAQSRIREAMNPFGATAVSLTRIEYQVDIFQIAAEPLARSRLIIPMPPKLTMRSCLPSPVVSTSQNATDAGR